MDTERAAVKKSMKIWFSYSKVETRDTLKRHSFATAFTFMYEWEPYVWVDEDPDKKFKSFSWRWGHMKNSSLSSKFRPSELRKTKTNENRIKWSLSPAVSFQFDLIQMCCKKCSWLLYHNADIENYIYSGRLHGASIKIVYRSSFVTTDAENV